ncbi:MAG: pyrroline-5-carboxylate reductase [Armatimonadota bacterium]|nr:pyrroline-5-carboxylate reductase [Armatimonadota bacterium]MDR7410084.1 pyrroline-5-carboxylate reductase [Armatimonadota bacterium]MDR7412515.1 pyrroline-5-carboxylate reductase [Armatimonadota bacterium]
MVDGKIYPTVGFVGAGNMAEALISGMRAAGWPAERIWVTNRSNRARLDWLRARYGVQTTQEKEALCGASQVLVLAVKPKDVPEATSQLKPLVRPGHRLLSVVAGLTLSSLERAFPGTPVVRAMPNTPSAVREGVTAYALGRWAGQEDARLAQELFGSVGAVVEVPEERIDLVTGLSGSGPAYVFFLVESLIEAGVRSGLPPEVARDLVVQTVFGAARMLRETGEDPAELRRRVTSPGGTTMAGVGALEEHGVRGAFLEAVQRAARRARELAS